MPIITSECIFAILKRHGHSERVNARHLSRRGDENTP